MQVYYFTRTHHSEEIAQELGKRLGASVHEIKDTHDYQGPIGYLKAGRASLGKYTYQIQYDALESGDLYLVFPIWAGSFPPAVRTFINKEGRARIILVPTSLGSILKDREGFKKVIDMPGKQAQLPDTL